MNGAEFPEDILIADDGFGGSAVVFEVLRGDADDRVGVEYVPFSDACHTLDGDLVHQIAAIADLDVGSDHAKRPDADILSDFSGRIDKGLV